MGVCGCVLCQRYISTTRVKRPDRILRIWTIWIPFNWLTDWIIIVWVSNATLVPWRSLADRSITTADVRHLSIVIAECHVASLNKTFLHTLNKFYKGRRETEGISTLYLQRLFHSLISFWWRRLLEFVNTTQSIKPYLSTNILHTFLGCPVEMNQRVQDVC